MSSSESDISNDSDSRSYNSEDRYSADEVQEESETLGACAAASIADVDDEDEFENDEGPHQFDSVADEAYTAEYRRDIAETREEENRLIRLFEGVETLESWYVLPYIDSIQTWAQVKSDLQNIIVIHHQLRFL